MPDSFGKQLASMMANRGQLCVGIDPSSELLSLWGLEDSAQGAEIFARTIVNSSTGRVGVVKPQIAFFERFGSAGFAALERTISDAKQAGLLVISDAKRGDIGSTMEGYLQTWLGKTSTLASSAVTVSPFLGLSSITDLLPSYLERGKGIFVLVATSNPEGASIQQAKVGDETISESLYSQIERINRVTVETKSMGSIGVVVGATLTSKRLRFLETGGGFAPILAPGFGAQGARLEDIGRIFGSSANRVLASVSRSLSEAGSLGFSDAVDRANDQLRAGLEG